MFRSTQGTTTHLSRTQELLTKITQICQEVRDIKRSNKSNNITKLPELSQHYNHSPESSDKSGKHDPDDAGYYTVHPLATSIYPTLQTCIRHMRSIPLKSDALQFHPHHFVPKLPSASWRTLSIRIRILWRRDEGRQVCRIGLYRRDGRGDERVVTCGVGI
jgi:hypothetical protein